MPREAEFKQNLCADIDGFSLHAAVRCGAEDRQALEQLCGYITRPALANERVQTNAAGQLVLKLKTPWRDGTAHWVMSPLEIMQRLAALVAGATAQAAPDPLWCPRNFAARSERAPAARTRRAGSLIYNFGQAARAGGAARARGARAASATCRVRGALWAPSPGAAELGSGGSSASSRSTWRTARAAAVS